MAGEKQTTTNTELDDMAFDIFKETVAKSQTGRGGERQAKMAYQKAESFLAVREAVRNGDLEPSKQDGPMLTDCCAPNLKRTHPHNLVSTRFGDLKKVDRINQWLSKNPTPEGNPDELIDRAKKEFPELEWDLPTINTARAIFPSYCKS
jgi:hypothetical protein